jgi:hypothetical protein
MFLPACAEPAEIHSEDTPPAVTAAPAATGGPAAAVDATAAVADAAVTWSAIGTGVELGYRGDLHVARLDPALVTFRVVQGEPRTAQQVGESLDALAVINTSMFRPDGRSVGYLRDGAAVNNPHRAAQNGLFVARPHHPGLPGARLLDAGCVDWDESLHDWDLVVQSIRMLDCHGRNTWSEQPKRWSAAVVGMDTSGRILFIHTRKPRSMHALTEELRAPLALASLQYAEGGPEAQLWVGGQAWVGSYETGFNENDANTVAWPVPNLLVALPGPTP